MGSSSYENNPSWLLRRLRDAACLTFVFLGVVIATSSPALAQTGQLRGTVTYKEKADGPAAPRADVEIVILRKDIKSRWTTKTDKKGGFIYTLPAFGTYYVCAFGKGLRADVSNPSTMTSDLIEVNFEMYPGDGSRPTDEQILASTGKAAGGGTKPTGPTKEEIEKYEKEKAEFEKAKAENEKVKADFTEMEKHFKIAVELDNKKDFVGAVTEYRQASTFDPTQHVVFARLAGALYNVGAVKFNEASKTRNPDLKEEAKKLFQESAQAGLKAVSLSATDMAYKTIAAQSLGLLGQYFGDFESLQKAGQLYKEAADAQTVPAEKNKLLVKTGELYFSAGRMDEAVALYRSVLEADPNNYDAMYDLAIATITDPAKPECIKLFETVAEKAPATNPHKAEAADFAKTLREAAKPTGKKK